MKTINNCKLPNGAVEIGTGEWGGDPNATFYYVTDTVGLNALASLSVNSEGQPTPLSYSVEEGSQIGFSQKFGVKVSGGANIPFVAEGKVEISGEIGFTQAFSKVTKQSLTATVEPGTQTTIYEAVVNVTYYAKYNMLAPLPNMPKVIVCPSINNDVIETGAYEVYTQSIEQALSEDA